jgi:hypothetical protein
MAHGSRYQSNQEGAIDYALVNAYSVAIPGTGSSCLLTDLVDRATSAAIGAAALPDQLTRISIIPDTLTDTVRFKFAAAADGNSAAAPDGMSGMPIAATLARMMYVISDSGSSFIATLYILAPRT